MIRLATLDDVPAIVDLGVRYATSKRKTNSHPVKAASLVQITTNYILSGGVYVYEDDEIRGVIGVGVFPHPFSDELTAYEVFWWTDPESPFAGLRSVRLLKAAEGWAKDHGATLMQMAAPEGSKVGRLYERLGFGRVEAMYQRRI